MTDRPPMTGDADGPTGDRPSLGRRHFLKILAGVPIAIGLPAAYWLRAGADDDGDGGAGAGSGSGGDIGRAVQSARRLGRVAVLVAVPVAKAGCDPTIIALRETIARTLTELAESPDQETQLALGQALVVAAPSGQLEAALPSLLELTPSREPPVAEGVYVIDLAAPEARARKLDDVDFATNAPDLSTRLARHVRDAVFGPERRRLRERAAAELAALPDATRREVEDALARLGGADEADREAASAALAAHREKLRAAFAVRTLDEALPAPVRARCGLLARPDGRIEPLGTEWVHPAAPDVEIDPCPPCGMAVLAPREKDYLKLIAGQGGGSKAP